MKGYKLSSSVHGTLAHDLGHAHFLHDHWPFERKAFSRLPKNVKKKPGNWQRLNERSDKENNIILT